tara:strand:- start:36 stop:1793 length:1758 start_codon:yes stop_codon:yes gene_type:complete
MTVGKLNVVAWGGMVGGKRRNQWWCKCDCGETGYFLTDASSLKKGLTRSCGCNYKNNGRSSSTERGDSYLEDRIDHRYKVTNYRGMEHKCTVSCTICGDSSDKYTGYSIRQRGLFCSCKEGDNTHAKAEGIAKWLASYDYKVLDKRGISNNSSIVSIQCNHCEHKIQGIEAYSVKNRCLCTERGSPDNDVSSVYLLRDKNNPKYFKIGKAGNPYARVSQIQKSVEKWGYDHQWVIKGIKWFSNEKVALHVEHTYHRFFKGKELYKYKADKTRGELEFDGAGETFILDAQDFESFNTINKSFLEYLEVNKPKLILKYKFNHNINRVFSKNKVTGVFIPSTPYLLNLLGYEDNTASRKCVTSNNSMEGIIEALRSTNNVTKDVEIEGVIYFSVEDFYEEHLHLRGIEVNFKLFRDRYVNKGWDAFSSINEDRKTKKHYKIKDLNNEDITFIDFYRKYQPLCAYQTMKDMIQRGCPLEDVIDYTPKDHFTNVYIYKDKYYSKSMLYDLMEVSISKATFYSRVSRGWDIDLAATTEECSEGNTPSKYKEDIVGQLKEGSCVDDVYLWCLGQNINITKQTIHKYKRNHIK